VPAKNFVPHWLCSFSIGSLVIRCNLPKRSLKPAGVRLIDDENLITVSIFLGFRVNDYHGWFFPLRGDRKKFKLPIKVRR